MTANVWSKLFQAALTEAAPWGMEETIMVVILFSQGTLRVCKTAAAGIRLACLIDSPSTQGCQGNKGESHTYHSEVKLPCPQGHGLLTKADTSELYFQEECEEPTINTKGF